MRDGATQVGKGQITQEDSIEHVRELRFPPESNKEPLMSFKQWKDLSISEVLKDHSSRVHKAKGKSESWQNRWEAVAVKQ